MKNNVPKLRFPEFTDAWEQRKLGAECKITMGQSPKSENYTKNPEDFILVQGNADMENGEVIPRVWTKQITKLADKGDIIFSVRAPVGEVARTKYQAVLGRGVSAIKGNEFIFQLLHLIKLRRQWEKLSTGSTFDSIGSDILKDFIFSRPTLPEQQKIGSFFRQLDSLITLHQYKYFAHFSRPKYCHFCLKRKEGTSPPTYPA